MEFKQEEKVIGVELLEHQKYAAIDFLLPPSVDGRTYGLQMPKWLCTIYDNLIYNPNEKSYYDASNENRLYEIRVMTENGVDFVPSYMKGIGRSYNEREYLIKLDNIQGYLITSLEYLPNTIYYKYIPSVVVKNGVLNGRVPTRTISFNKARKVIFNNFEDIE